MSKRKEPIHPLRAWAVKEMELQERYGAATLAAARAVADPELFPHLREAVALVVEKRAASKSGLKGSHDATRKNTDAKRPKAVAAIWRKVLSGKPLTGAYSRARKAVEDSGKYPRRLLRGAGAITKAEVIAHARKVDPEAASRYFPK